MHAHSSIHNNYLGGGASSYKNNGSLRINPYRNHHSNSIYEMLFCDETALFRNELSVAFYPWDVLYSPDSTAEDIKSICQNKLTESCPKLIGYQLLNSKGIQIKETELVGVVIEIHQRNGLDVLSVYSDGTARYINHSENIINWEVPSPSSGLLTNTLFNAAKNLSQNLTPWFFPRKNYPAKGDVRVSLLMSNGLHFKEGDFLRMRNEQSTSTLIETSIQFMLFLANHRNRQDKIKG